MCWSGSVSPWTEEDHTRQFSNPEDALHIHRYTYMRNRVELEFNIAVALVTQNTITSSINDGQTTSKTCLVPR